MKDKIKLLLIIPLLFLTGCSVQYNLRVDWNLNFKEEVILLEKNQILEIYNKNLKLIPEQKFSQYKSVDGFKPYKLTKEIFSNEETGGIIKADFKGTENFKNSMLLTALFSGLNVTEYGNIVSIQTTGYDPSIFVAETDPNFFLKDIIVNIRFHNKVVENNANKYDEKTNTYTWFLTTEQSSGNIAFSIDRNQKRYDIIFKDFIDENIFIISISSILLVVLLIVGYRLYIKNKNINKI